MLVAGAAAVFAGVQPLTLPAVIDLFNGEEDVLIYGADSSDYAGRSTSSIGAFSHITADVNGDGSPDLVFGAPLADGPLNARAMCGEIYVYYGPLAAGTLDVAGTAGNAPDVVIYGGRGGDNLGYEGGLTCADINNDGIEDILAGAYGADGPGFARAGCGELYVIYGSAALPAVIDIANGDQDVTVYGASASDALTAGYNLLTKDFNGDGITDIMTGAQLADGPSDARSGCGEVYIIYGSAGLPAAIDLASGAEDVTIYGASASDGLGFEYASCAGDLNGDGISDMILGSVLARGPLDARNACGEAYVIYGSAALPAVIDLASGDENVTVYGATALDRLTHRRGLTAGDVNGDGIDDLVLGAWTADGPAEGRSAAGEAYVIYGGAALPATIDIALNEEDVTIYGATANDQLNGWCPISLGDVNGDGRDDILLSAFAADGPGDGRLSAGEGYLIYGSGTLPATIDLASSGEDVTIYGASAGDQLAEYAGISAKDVNGDGLADILTTAAFGSGPAEGRSSSGESYIIYGSTAVLPATIDLNASEEDVTIYGASNFDMLNSGFGLQTGDINNDGFLDLLLAAYGGDGPGEVRNGCGEVYAIFGEGDSTTATAKDTDHAGNPLAKDYGTARAKIDFGAGAAASTTTVKLTRNDTGVNMPDLTKVADVNWTVTTNRANFSAKVIFHYLESEIAQLTEGDLKLYKAATVGGTYSEVTGAVFDTVRNTVTATGLTGFSVFILSTVAPAAAPSPHCFVDTLSSGIGKTASSGRTLFPALALAGVFGAFFFIRSRR